MPTSTNSQERADGVIRKAFGHIVTTSASAAAVTITLGFEPKHINFHNLTDRISDEWYYGMADAESLHTVAAGTRTLETTNGITVTDDTFTLTATTMVASKVFFWEAEG